MINEIDDKTAANDEKECHDTDHERMDTSDSDVRPGPSDFSSNNEQGIRLIKKATTLIFNSNICLI